MIKDFITIMTNVQSYWGDLPINILIDGKYYDIKDLFFDDKIHEYILQLEGGINYETRADICIPFKVELIEDDKMIERFIVDDAGSLIDKDTGKSYDYFDEVITLLNIINHERIENKRELNTLKHRIKKIVEV